MNQEMSDEICYIEYRKDSRIVIGFLLLFLLGKSNEERKRNPIFTILLYVLSVSLPSMLLEHTVRTLRYHGMPRGEAAAAPTCS